MSTPAGWHGESHTLWAQGQQGPALQALVGHINAIVKSGSKPDARIYDQMAYYMFLRKEYPAALSALQWSLKLAPDNTQTERNLAVIHQRLEQNEAAVEHAMSVLMKEPSDFLTYDVLCAALQKLRRFDEARKAGTAALRLKDEHIQKTLPAPRDWLLPTKRRSTGLRELNGRRNVIAFSLWGQQPRYLRGALQNLLVARQVYPGWTLRFHLDDSVPAEFPELLRQLGAEVVHHPGSEHGNRERLCWRFSVANDPTVGYFLVRDVDSVINTREAMAVDAWLAGSAHFHVLRDWWTHTDLMLAGMWGGVAGVLPDLTAMLTAYKSNVMETPNIDQIFLRDCVWSLVRPSVCVHDRMFTPPLAQPMPAAPAPSNVANLHIGQDEFTVAGQHQASLLKAWCERYPWL